MATDIGHLLIPGMPGVSKVFPGKARGSGFLWPGPGNWLSGLLVGRILRTGRLMETESAAVLKLTATVAAFRLGNYGFCHIAPLLLFLSNRHFRHI